MSTVLKDWVIKLPLMMQGTLMTGVRGPDTASCPNLKPVGRWIRSLILVNGNPENDFMEVQKLPAVEEFEKELEYLPIHYFTHLVHCLEIIGYKHPDGNVAAIALEYYFRLCDWLHMFPEPEEEMDIRLSGKSGTTGEVRRWSLDVVGDRTYPVREVVREVIVEKPVHHYRGSSGYS